MSLSLLVSRGASRRLPWVVTALLLLLGTTTAAYAFWASTTSSNNAVAAADALTPGSQPAVSASGAAVTVTWAGGTTVNGHPATGYTVSRYSTATGGTGIPATGGCAGTVTTLTCTEQNVPGGVWYYTVTPAIALWTGQESPRSNGVSSDSTAPTATVSGISPTPNTAGWNNTSPVTVTVTADDGTSGSGVASVSYAVDGGAQQTVSAAVATIPVSGDGTHTVSYFATDNAGNAGSAQSQTVRVDTQAPAAPGLSVPAYVNSANVAAVSVTGTAEAGATVTLVAADAGSAHSVPVTVTASGTGTWSASLDLTTLNQGAVTYSATATDVAGNTSAANTATSTKDTVAPAAAQGLSVPAYVYGGNVSSVPVSGSAEAGATVTVTAADTGTTTPVTGTATASGTGTWSLNLNLGTLNQGTINYSATVKDAAGNTSSAATASDTKDTVAPVLTIAAPMYVNLSNYTSVKVTGTTDTSAMVNVTARSSVTNSITAQVTPSSPSWSVNMDLTSLDQGTVTFTASSTDAAGNTGTASAASTTTKDTVAPATKSVTLATATTGGAKSGTVDKGDTVSVTFTEAMDVGKFCTGWSGSSLNGTATIANGSDPAKDTISFSTSSCPGLTIGTINLGADYVGSTAAVFAGTQNGNSGNIKDPSTLSWDSGTNSLVITLGALTSGSVPNPSPANGLPGYTPAAGLADVAGNPLPTSPGFTSTSASRF